MLYSTPKDSAATPSLIRRKETGLAGRGAYAHRNRSATRGVTFVRIFGFSIPTLQAVQGKVPIYGEYWERASRGYDDFEVEMTTHKASAPINTTRIADGDYRDHRLYLTVGV